MGRFRVTVTKRSEEWVESNPPLASDAQALGCQTPDTPGHEADSRNALGCAAGNLDTPGYGDGPAALGCTIDTPGYGDDPSALGCAATTDTPGYGGPLSPLSD